MAMHVACHIFTYTLKDSARIWGYSKAGSILNYEDLKVKLRSHFSQQKRFTKTHLAVHNIKQIEGESVRAFATRYTDDTLQILGLHKDQHISGFVHGLRTRNLVEHLFIEIPSTYKGLMEKTYIWIEAREIGTNRALNDQRDNFERLSKSSCDNDMGQKSRDSQIEEAVKSGQLSHLIKGIKKERAKAFDSQRGEKKEKSTTLGEKSWAIEEVLLEITIGDAPLLISETLKFVIPRSSSLYNMLLGRTTMHKIGMQVPRTDSHHQKVAIGTHQRKITKPPKDQHRCLCVAYADMTGIPRTIMIGGKPFNTKHKLNEYRHIKPIKQKIRSLGLDRCTTARKEVEEFTKAGILREAVHQTWVANPIMVKKNDKGWRMFQSINMKLKPKKFSFGVEEGPFLGQLITKKGTRANPLKWTQEAAAALLKMKKFVKTLPTLTEPIHGEVQMMYLAALTESIRTTLFARREKGHVPLNLVSRILQGAKALMKPEKLGHVAKWPIKLREHDIVDVARIIQNYKKCKDHIAMRKRTEIETIAAQNAWPFSHWGVSILGPLQTALGVCRFGVPQIISLKDDMYFKEGIFPDLYRGLKIIQSFSRITEYIEIISRIKKLLTRSQQGWADNLPQVLWIHKTLPRNNQKVTLFSLTYGSEAIILTVKSNVAKDERERTKEVTKRKEIKEVALIKEAYYKNELRMYHNKRRNHSTYKVGDFVLLLQNNTENPQEWQGPHMIREVPKELYKIIVVSDHSLIQTAKGINLHKFYM
uniref:Retrotransposon gag domain-containing protein n=1 Tax=Tanacetum cinerariifolium TaxID=118510 RepID=A0A6L2MF91_TANCI|nr:hypothetical protein [Tanacetum cinerariifolium]